MPVYKIKRKTLTISLPEEDYRYIEQQIQKNQDTIRTVPGYVRRLVRHYIRSLQIEEEIQQSQKHLKKLQKELEEYATTDWSSKDAAHHDSTMG